MFHKGLILCVFSLEKCTELLLFNGLIRTWNEQNTEPQQHWGQTADQNSRGSLRAQIHIFLFLKYWHVMKPSRSEELNVSQRRILFSQPCGHQPVMATLNPAAPPATQVHHLPHPVPASSSASPTLCMSLHPSAVSFIPAWSSFFIILCPVCPLSLL